MHALFSCAGVADGTPGIEKINFIGHRHLIDRAIEQGLLGRGAAIGFISSTAGLGWRKHLDEVKAYLADAPDWDSAVAWIEANPDKASYTWSKQSINVYVQGNALELLKQGIRPYEVPISYKARSREDGKKLTWKDGVEALWILTRERFRARTT